MKMSCINPIPKNCIKFQSEDKKHVLYKWTDLMKDADE